MYSIQWRSIWETSSTLQSLPWTLDVQSLLFTFLSIEDILRLKKVSRHYMKCVRIYELLINFRQDIRGHSPQQHLTFKRQQLLPHIQQTPSMRLHFGDNHLVLALTSHSIVSRGNNFYGQLGNNTRSLKTPGEKLPFVQSQLRQHDPYVCSVHGGVDATFVLTCSGNIISWGRNANGILGHGHNKMILPPTTIPPSFHHRTPICKLDVYTDTAIALTPSGKVYTWGYYANFEPHSPKIIDRGTFSTINQPTLQKALCFQGAHRIVDISAGHGFFVALTQNRYHVLTWGRSCCYNESDRNHQSIGVTRVKGLRLGAGRHVTSISAGMEHALATISVPGQVFSWGNQEQGALGRRQNADAYIPQCIHPKAFNYRTIVKVTAGSSHSLFLDDTGNAYFAGCLSNMSEKRFNPKMIARDLIDIRSASYHSILIHKNKHVYVFGDNDYGEIGPNLPTLIKQPVLLR